MKFKTDKPEISGLIILFIGVALLVFTFLNAYWLLAKDITIVASQDLVKAFGEALAPLVATCIHVMYLGIMGWIGSLLTLRGIPLLTQPKTMVAQQPQVTTVPIAEAKPVKKEQKEPAKQEKIEKPQPPEKPVAKPTKEEAGKEKEPEKQPGISVEVRQPEEIAATTSKPTPPTSETPKEQPSK